MINPPFLERSPYILKKRDYINRNSRLGIAFMFLCFFFWGGVLSLLMHFPCIFLHFPFRKAFNKKIGCQGKDRERAHRAPSWRLDVCCSFRFFCHGLLGPADSRGERQGTTWRDGFRASYPFSKALLGVPILF